MTYVVTKKCIGCKDMSCMRVCPVESFHEGPEMLYINPEVCIDCDSCIHECPVDAIYPDDELPHEHASDLALNASASQTYPIITG